MPRDVYYMRSHYSMFIQIKPPGPWDHDGHKKKSDTSLSIFWTEFTFSTFLSLYLLSKNDYFEYLNVNIFIGIPIMEWLTCVCIHRRISGEGFLHWRMYAEEV